MFRHTVLPAAMFTLSAAASAWAAGSGDHSHDDGDAKAMIEAMAEEHAGHDHGHDFAAVEAMSGEDLDRVLGFLTDVGLVLPPFDSERGRTVFLAKGCIVCHAVNGVGGDIGPVIDAASMAEHMNAYEFAARMWRGAPAMAQMQQDLLGAMIDLDGQELADIVAFVHDAAEQAEVGIEDVPPQFRGLIAN